MATGSVPAAPVILVVGATGDLGQRVVRRLQKGGHQVRALVRPNSDPGSTVPEGVGIVRGDLRDPASLFAACEGVSTVVLTATAIGRRLAGERVSIRDVDQRGGLALVGAAESAGVARFVYMSFPGAEGGSHTPLEQAKLAVEQRLRTCAMQPVIVRADAFQEIHLSPVARFDVAQGKVSIIGRGDCERRWIATEDVAALVAAVTLEADAPEVVEVGGPESISKNRLVELAERTSGRRIKTQHMPRQLARIVIALAARFNDALASALGAGLQQDLLQASWDDTPLRERGIQPQSASDYVTRIAKGTR